MFMKKMRPLLAVCSLLFGIAACQKDTQVETGKKTGQEQPAERRAETDLPDNTDSPDDGQAGTLGDYIEIAAGGCKAAREREDIRQKNVLDTGTITYRADRVRLTKQQGDWTDLSGPQPALDENGRITDGRTYVVVDVAVRQEGEFDFWWNIFRLSYFTEDELRIGPGELVSASILTPDSEKNKDMYQYSLPEGETIETSLVFVAEDSELEEAGRHFLLGFNPTGANIEQVEPEDYSMVFLESLEYANRKQAFESSF